MPSQAQRAQDGRCNAVTLASIILMAMCCTYGHGLHSWPWAALMAMGCTHGHGDGLHSWGWAALMAMGCTHGDGLHSWGRHEGESGASSGPIRVRCDAG